MKPKRAPPLLLAALLALQGAAWAGPVASEASDSGIVGSATGTAGAPTAIGSHAAAAAAANALGELHPGAGSAATPAASAASASALALQMLKEANAGEAAQPARRDHATAASTKTAQGPAAQEPKPDDDPWGLRETAKATVRWVKGVIPWLDDGEAAEAGKEVVLNHSDWSGSPAGHARGNDASRLPSAHQAAQPEDEVVYGEVQRKQLSGAEGNVIREILELLRLVLEHPMTWLVVSLVVAGGIVVKRIDRRPTK